jgi:hypothetical protein
MFALLTAILIAEPAPAAPCPKAEPIQLVVVVILANDKNTKIDDRIREVAAEVSKKDPQLTGFEHHKTFKKSLKIGDNVQVDLVGNAKAEVRVNEQTDNHGRVTITIKPPMLDEITYACTCGKFFPIITNHYTPEKKRLIIAVMAQPCKKKP